MWAAIKDALIDSSITLAVILVINFIISFVEERLARSFAKNKKESPLIGAAVGLIPQCGFPIIAADLYKNRHITMGTLVAVFIACSDEALPIMLSNVNTILPTIPLIIIKFVLGFLVGYLVDVIFTKKKLEINSAEKIETETNITIVGCCNHEIEGEEKGEKHPWIHDHIIHPLIHSLKLFAYILVINIAFSLLIYYVGENTIADFLNTNVWLTPLFATLVGMIPNCASSVIIVEMYISGSLYFGAALAGLIINAGLGMLFLFKNVKDWKNNLTILGIIFALSLIAGYITIAVQMSFNI
ncbi:MAG: arsenic efflux protein [Erysipelotrichaceae bacterium]|jgi:hypothetical protein|nr:arsenic efflux protein [Erysipelotrichaceae bacterium]